MPRKRPPAPPAHYHEPLWARRSYTKWNRPPSQFPPEADAAECERLVREWEESDKCPAWVVWGRDLFRPEVAILEIADNLGEMHLGAGSLFTISLCKGQEGHAVAPELMAKRIVECMNAFAGIASPYGFMAEVTDLLSAIVREESFDYQGRAEDLLARMGKPVSRTSEDEDE